MCWRWGELIVPLMVIGSLVLFPPLPFGFPLLGVSRLKCHALTDCLLGNGSLLVDHSIKSPSTIHPSNVKGAGAKFHMPLAKSSTLAVKRRKVS